MSIGYLFETRLLLEADAATLAAVRIDDAQLDRISKLVEASAAELDHVNIFLTLDHEFHTAVVEATGNPVLVGLYRSINELLIESRARTVGSRAIRQRAVNAHSEIVGALRAGDSAQAAEAVRRHLHEVHELWQAAEGTDAATDDEQPGRPKPRRRTATKPRGEGR